MCIYIGLSAYNAQSQEKPYIIDCNRSEFSGALWLKERAAVPGLLHRKFKKKVLLDTGDQRAPTMTLICDSSLLKKRIKSRSRVITSPVFFRPFS